MLPYGKGPRTKDVATTDVMVLDHLCFGDDLRVPFWCIVFFDDPQAKTLDPRNIRGESNNYLKLRIVSKTSTVRTLHNKWHIQVNTTHKLIHKHSHIIKHLKSPGYPLFLFLVLLWLWISARYFNTKRTISTAAHQNKLNFTFLLVLWRDTRHCRIWCGVVSTKPHATYASIFLQPL